MSKRTTRKAQALTSRTAARLHDLLDSADDLLESLEDEHGEKVDRLRDNVAATVTAASRQLDSLGKSATSVGRDVARSGARFVRSDPWRTAAIAAIAAVGVIFLATRGDD